MEAKLADKKELVEAVIHSPATSRKSGNTPASTSDTGSDNQHSKEPRTGIEAPTVAEFGLINCEEYFLMVNSLN